MVITSTARGEEFAVVDTGAERCPLNLITAEDAARTVCRRIVA